MERFIKEYANYTKKSIEGNEEMQPEIKEKAIRKIEKNYSIKGKRIDNSK